MISAVKKDYYKILEVEEGASLEQIEKSYRELLQVYDHDASGTYSLYEDDERDNLIAEIKEAYIALSGKAVLGEPDRKVLHIVESATPKLDIEKLKLIIKIPELKHEKPGEPQKIEIKEDHCLSIIKNCDFERVNGAFLKKLRETKGVTFKDITQETKINTDIINMLESDEYLKLPARIYVLGFVKLYFRIFTGEYEKLGRAYIKLYDDFFLKRLRTK